MKRFRAFRAPLHWLLEIFNGNIIAIGLIPVLALIIYGVFRLTKGTVYA
ncbi:hypothetical protein G3O28_001741 [Salmonella enterica]|uniref:Uncharacterized protein n=1 Tax=Salmonella montevideo TaxID=115981 RepID=A0A738MBY6_SALMO|nr:hypothetical protein [Salmonella enterica subsp. enterica serovar Montevideo]EDU0013261.1 hypothetical protein [Salmonella enterica]EEH7299985.1 hypothetical protein [Salmonella enterica subsp. enterica]EDS2222440.1 hypothetical protein [Salmonella enterica subsp. enterica serovar Montevideo]EDS3442448.1 hypothetical protein [Salmonella enterica subsp. enterica serovar Montevideo]